MKLSKNWKRIIAGFLAFTMVFLSMDGGCITALAAEIQERNNEVEISMDFPTGGQLDLEAIKMDETDGIVEAYDYRDLADVQMFSEEYNSEWDKYSTNYYYNQLNDEWQLVWDSLDILMLDKLSGNSSNELEEYITVPEGTTEDDLYAFVFLFLESNPQYYFLKNAYRFYEDEEFVTSFTIKLYEDFQDDANRADSTELLKGKIDDAIESINADLSSLEVEATEEDKLQAIYEYVIHMTDYNDLVVTDKDEEDEINDTIITPEEEEDYYTQSVYSAFTIGLTVCAGYTEAVQLLCNALDVDAINVTSDNHKWNKVRVNECWYNVDATWGDFGDEYETYFEYYGRSDAYYDADEISKAESHTEEDYWEKYIPLCIQDSKRKNVDENNLETENYWIPRTFYVPEIAVPTPTINVTKKDNDTYSVEILVNTGGTETYKDAVVYYTIDSTEPSVAATKSKIYTEPFVVEGGCVIKAIAVLDGYYDSEIAEKKATLTIENATIQNHFYQSLNFVWDALGDNVDGYMIRVHTDAATIGEGNTIDVVGGDTNFYSYDTSALPVGMSIYYEICGYTLDEDNNKHQATEVAASGRCTVNQLSESLDVDVKWHVTTDGNNKYLVISVEENAQTEEELHTKLGMWYSSDSNGVNSAKNFTLDMVDGATEFKYSFNEHGLAYDESGYVFITDVSKATAFQKGGFEVGGVYKEPELESIENVTLSATGDIATLQAVITSDTKMNNFKYKYQWYEASDATSKGNAIEGATDSVYVAQIGSFDEKYYYCEVTVEYITSHVVTTTNGTKTEDGVDEHTRVEGALYATKISYELLDDEIIYDGNEKTPGLVLKNDLYETLIPDVDYEVKYKDNTDAGEATILVHFKGIYDTLEDAVIHFEIKPKEASRDTLEFTDVVTDRKYVYNNMAYAPDMVVYDPDRGTNLSKDIDYTIAYSGNIDAGTATITLKFQGNYAGTVYINFEIEPKSAERVTVGGIHEHVFTGLPIIPDLAINDNDFGSHLVVNKDYTVSCVNNTHVGTADVKITFIGNYKGEATTSFVIVQQDAREVSVEAIEDQEYTGVEITPTLDVEYRYGDFATILTKETDYTVEYTDNIELGIAKVKLSFRGDYKGTKEVTFHIVPRTPENLIYEPIVDCDYTGEAHTPELSIKNGNISLDLGIDYDVVYSDNINASTLETMAKATVTFKGNYAGEKVLTFKINPKSAIGFEVTLEELGDYTYSGNEFKPSVTVTDDEIPLVEGEEGDFTVSYENNINAGTATVIVTYRGNYEGETSLNFTIKPKAITEEQIIIEDIAAQTYNGKAIVPALVVKEAITEDSTGNILRPGEDYTVAGYENTYVGIATLVVSLNLEGNYIYTGEDIEVKFEILPRDSANVKIETIPNQTYTGSAITPDLVVKDGDIILVEGHDYYVTYKNNTNVGTATVIITFDGNFTGTEKSATFVIINPIPTGITSSVFSIDQVKNYISKITVGTTAHTLLSNLNEKKYVSIFDKNGEKTSSTTVLGTGMTTCIMNGSKVERKYTIIVTGDVAGSYHINVTDMIAVKAHILGKTPLSGAALKAADVNAKGPDGKVNITDFIRIKAHVLKKDTITGMTIVN